MATATTAPGSRRARSSAAAATARKPTARNGSKSAQGPVKTAKRVAKTAKGARKVQRQLPGKAGSMLTFVRAIRLARRLMKKKLPAAQEALREVAERLPGAAETLRDAASLARGQDIEHLTQQLRHVPVQLSLDVAVPVEVAFKEWMRLESLPEGDHRVQDIERRGEGRLVGRIHRLGADHEWEAEVRDERPNESFAWRSVRGSDVAGLVTFHRLGERLTRLEVQLDVVPVSVGEAVTLALHLADRMAETELRHFKSRVETISPDAYPAGVNHTRRRSEKRESQSRRSAKRTNHSNGRASQGKAPARSSRNQRKEE